MNAERIRHPLWVLLLVRLKVLVREPRILFWSSGFPMLLAFALGGAFRGQTVESLIGVVPGPNAESVAAAIDASPRLAVQRMSLEEARDGIRHATIVLAVEPTTDGVKYHFDPTRADTESSRLLVDDILQRAAGRRDTLGVTPVHHATPGGRYVDWLIPALIGMQMMMGCLTGFGYALTSARESGVLKRFAATPMKRWHYLLAFILARTILTAVEVPLMVVVGRLAFDVRVYGSFVSLAIVSVFGTLAFSGIALLMAARTRRSEAMSGLVSIVSMPNLILSGVFFSSARFPDKVQPLIKALPLTALNDVLRGVMNDGASLVALGPRLMVLGAWGLVSFVLALRLFQWR